MDFQEMNFEQISPVLWNVETIVRCTAGATIDQTDFPEGMKRLLQGTPLYLTENRKVAIVKTAKVVTAAAKNATSVEVEKGSLFKIGDRIAGGVISAVDTTNGEKDVFTVDAISSAIKAGDIVDDGNGANCIGLTYANVPLVDTCGVKADRNPSATWTIQVYDIHEDTLPHPLNATIKTALTARHHFAEF